MRRKAAGCFIALFVLCMISGCSEETIEEMAEETMEDIEKHAESQGITIDEDGSGEKYRHNVGEAVSMITDNSAEINVTVTEWGNYYDVNTNENLLYVSYAVENVGTQDAYISDGMFDIYADDYGVDFAYPLDAENSNTMGMTLSAGRKSESTFYAKVAPDTVNSIEVEYGDVIFVLKE